MFITNDGTADQSIDYCCFGGANIFTLLQGTTLSLPNLWLWSPNGNAVFSVEGTGGTWDVQPTININGKWNFSRTVTSSQCTDKQAGFVDTPVATITQAIDALSVTGGPTPPRPGGSVTVTTDAGETLTGSSDGNLVYVSEFQTVPATNTSSTTYELMTIAADGKSMAGTFTMNEITAKCSAQGTLTAAKQ